MRRANYCGAALLCATLWPLCVPAAETEANPAPAADSTTAPPAAKDIRVPYIPEPVKAEIRKQVREELKQEVVAEMLKQAREERWGMPGAWPEWVQRLSWDGDIRLRYQSDNFAPDNAVSLDIQRINQARRFSIDHATRNTSEDRQRLRVRARLGMSAQVSEGVDAVVRLATGSLNDPVSTNQTLGNTQRPFQAILDRVYLQLQSGSGAWTAWGGRIPNPWFGTDLVWDTDLNFDGVAVRLRPRRVGDAEVQTYGFDPFITLGAFPLQEVELSSKDKWLFGGQLGADWRFGRRAHLRFGIGYYDYKNIVGQRNAPGSTALDYTAPQFVQKGNSVFLINNDTDPSAQLWGLASEFEEVNATVSLDLAAAGTTHVVLTADYVKNIGFDAEDIFRRTGLRLFEEVSGYQWQIAVGQPRPRKRADWQVFGGTRHVEADAVLDAFTDSDFHLGGTNAEGWIAGGIYCLRDGLCASLRYLSANEARGDPLSVDTLQLDLSASF